MSLSWTFLASAWQISPAVEAESTGRLRVRPSIRVTATTIGLLVLVAWHARRGRRSKKFFVTIKGNFSQNK